MRRASRARGVVASWSDCIADGAVGPAGEGRGREGGMVVKEGASAGVPMVGLVERIRSGGSRPRQVCYNEGVSEPTTEPRAEGAGEDESTPRTPKARTTAFTDAQIEAGFWLLASRAHPLALELDETRTDETLFETLKPLIGKNNLTRDKVKKTIAPILAAKEAAAAGKLPQLSAARADEVRKLILKEWRISSSKGALLWPTGSRTIAVRLGKGKWNDALARLGLRASGRGRAQGSGRFNEAVMRTILTEFLETAEHAGLSATLGGYTSWSKEQRALGRQDVPSTASVRQRFGTWGKAMEFASRTEEDSGQGLG